MLEGNTDSRFNVGDGVFVLSLQEQNEINFNESEKNDLIKDYLYPLNISRYKINSNGMCQITGVKVKL
jgi:hypothetical protein